MRSAVVLLRFKNSKQTVDAATAGLSGRFSLPPRRITSLEPDESAPQTSVKHRRFQQDNELFCSGERFHSPLLCSPTREAGLKNRERKGGIETALFLLLPRGPLFQGRGRITLHSRRSSRWNRCIARQFYLAPKPQSLLLNPPPAWRVPHYASYGEKFPA